MKKLVGPYISVESYDVNGNKGESLYLNVPTPGGFVAKQKLTNAALAQGLDQSIKDALTTCKTEKTA